jgi:hypothetical protein
MFKKFGTILLIMVLLVTVLPLQQVGRMLFNNQWTEELNEHSDQSPEKKSQPVKWTFLSGGYGDNADGSSLIYARGHNIHYSQSLPVNPSGEIHSPPPNSFQ